MSIQDIVLRNDRYKTWGELRDIRFPGDSLRRKIWLVNGCFDGLHPGHLEFLKQAAAIAHADGEPLIVALNSDEYVVKKKGRPPLFSLWERLFMVMGLSGVNYATYFEEDTPERMMGVIRPWGVIRGYDQSDDTFGLFKLPPHGGYSSRIELRRLSKFIDVSTTSLESRIIQRMTNQQVAALYDQRFIFGRSL